MNCFSFFCRDRPAPTGWLRFFLVFVQVTSTLFTAGVIIGYSQLYSIMTDSGVYHWKCHSSNDHEKGHTCHEQIAALDSMFNIGASLSLFIQAPSGLVLTLLGPRATCLMGLCLMIPGSFLFAFSSVHFDAYLPAFLLLSAGGPWVYISSMPAAGLFPNYEGIVLMVLNGAYGGGALVFLMMELLYRYLGISMKTLFLAYGACLSVGSVLPFIFWPWKAYVLGADPVMMDDESYDDDYDDDDDDDGDADDAGGSSSNSFLSKVRTRCSTILSQMMTLPYIFLAFFVPFMVLKSNFLLSTLPQQLDAMNEDDEDLTDILNEVFGIALPTVGLLAGPVGLIIDHWGISAGIFLVVMLSSISSVIGVLPLVYLQPLRFLVFALYFPLVYATWGALLMLTFGFDNYGVLYAFIAIIAGCVNLGSTALVKLALHLDGFLWINIAFLGAGLAFIIYPLQSWIVELLTGNGEIKRLEEAIPLMKPTTTTTTTTTTTNEATHGSAHHDETATYHSATTLIRTQVGSLYDPSTSIQK